MYSQKPATVGKLRACFRFSAGSFHSPHVLEKLLCVCKGKGPKPNKTRDGTIGDDLAQSVVFQGTHPTGKPYRKKREKGSF